MGVVLAQNIAHYTGALAIGPVGRQPQFMHRVKDASLHWLEAIAGIGQRPTHDHAHGVFEVGALHLLMQSDRLNALLGHPGLDLLRADGAQPTDTDQLEQLFQGVLLGSAFASARSTASRSFGFFNRSRAASRRFSPQSCCF